MPTITNPGVIKALVTAYLLKDRNEALAGIEIGYAESYVYNGEYSKLFERSDVKAEIERQEIELIKKTGYSKEKAHFQLEQARRGAMTAKHFSAAVSAVNTNMRLHGMDQVADKDTVTVINVISYAGSAGVVPPKAVESEVIENVQE